MNSILTWIYQNYYHYLCYSIKPMTCVFFFNIPINMYSKDQKGGTSDLRTGTARFKCGLVMFTNVFFVHLSHALEWLPLTPMLFRYSICHGKLLFFLLYFYMSSQMFLFIPAAFLEQSLFAFTNIRCLNYLAVIK